MKSLFNAVTSLSLRFRLITLALVVVVSGLGIVAITQLKQELLPPIEFPSTFILAQVSGMTSEQALRVMTERIEAELQEIPDIVNIESTTTGAIGSFITASNDFGLNQERLRGEVQKALDRVWLPQRVITPEGDEAAEAFAARLLRDLPAEILVYIAENDNNFLFQLSPETWSNLSDETVRQTLAYLAAQKEEANPDKSPLERLVEQQLAPRLTSQSVIANVTISGGQALPGEAATTTVSESELDTTSSLLLKLSPAVWEVVAPKAGISGALDETAVERLSTVDYPSPDAPPTLPQSWQRDHYEDATDLLESRRLTQSIADILNNFVESGRIVSALGQTNDLTPEVITRMLEIEPSMVEYFEADHLVAMSPDVFAALPDEYVASLDGFTRDALAAAALAESISGEQAKRAPVPLPSPWRIQPPSIITFSFADLPVAIFSVYGTGEAAAQAAIPDTSDTNTPSDNQSTNSSSLNENMANTIHLEDIPEGPALPPFFALLGIQFGVEMNTADDLLHIQLPPEMASQLGGSTLRAADVLNFLVLLSDPDALPPGAPSLPFAVNVNTILSGFTPEAIAFLAQYDDTFLSSLSPAVYNGFSDAVLALPEAAPPLSDVWNTLSEQPQFSERPLRTAKDVIEIGNGSASTVLNTISESVPERFAGYDIRLFDSLSPAVVRYFALREESFYQNLNPAVLTAFAPGTLAVLPQDILDTLDPEQAARLQAIAEGSQPSAAAELSALYTTNVPAADPAAPAINSDWALIGNFYSIELDTADDFFRFPENFPFTSASAFMNSIFASPQGVAFAPNLFGGLTVDAVGYMLERDPAVFDDLIPEALQLLPAEVLAALPQALQERATSTDLRFTPTNQITRTNGASSLLVTVLKTADANTVEAYHTIEDIIQSFDAEHEDIGVTVAFEQSSFIEKSIEGVAREAGLGAVFAIIVILVFLSGGIWNSAARRTTGLAMVIIFAVLLVAVVLMGLNNAEGDIGRAFSESDVVIRVLLLLGFAAGLAALFWPGNLPVPSWRSTLVISVSIPLSILMALALMRWLPPVANQLLTPAAESSSFFAFILRLFPANLTLNIMTLSGLTVSVGRVVDDSIVVLENIFRTIQAGGNKREAILTGTRDVSLAIFSATAIAVVVFLPLGMTGGLVSEFFLPFGLAVTYALASSFVVAITVVPVLAYLLIDASNIPEEHGETWMERIYVPMLRWALGSKRNRLIVLFVAFLSMLGGCGLMVTRPQTFIPALGEPEISININMPAGTKILETNALAEEMEQYIQEALPADEIQTIRTTIGGGGLSFDSFFARGSVNEAAGVINVLLASGADLVARTQQLREKAIEIFGEENVVVSAASISEGGFGGFSLVVSGPQETLTAVDPVIIETLNGLEGLTNVSSNLSEASAAGSAGPTTYIRVNGQPAISYSGELETNDTLGLTRRAVEAIQAIPSLPDNVTVSQGFQSEIASSGFVGVIIAMGIAMVFVVIILIITFGSLVHWLDIILSVAVTPVGAAVALTLTNSTLGVSALIGLLMLIGIVVTNAVVLIDRVQANRRERQMGLYDSLVEAGGRRVRPILMTALATMIALIPLAVGLSEGAIIASELGIVVIGGLFTSTLLTLIVVPVAYSLLDPLHQRVSRAARVKE